MQTIQDEVQADGSVTRTITSVTVQNFTPQQYQDMQASLQKSIDGLQGQLDSMSPKLTTIAQKLSTNKVMP